MPKRFFILLSLSLAIAACGDDDAVTDTGPAPDVPPINDAGPGDDAGPMDDAGPTDDAGPMDVGPIDSGPIEDAPDAGPVPPDDFDFPMDDPSTYTRIDRLGMPAVSTALLGTNAGAYNDANPSNDVAMEFVPQLIGGVAALHTALDDDLTAALLTPCTVAGDGTGSCVAVAGPLVIPDTLKIDGTRPAGFPNGRMLPDPVIDVTLAVLLLDLAGGTHTASDLVGVLNPSENDVPFQTDFPYLAPAH